MESLSAAVSPSSSSQQHRKLSQNKSDSVVVMSDERQNTGGNSGNKRRKSTVSRVSSLPGDSKHVHYQHLQQTAGSGGLKRSRSSRRSYRGRASPRTSSSSEYNGGGSVGFSTPSMAKAEQLLLQNSMSSSLHRHYHHHHGQHYPELQQQQQLEVGESLTNYSGASITSLKLSSTPPSYSNHSSTRQSFRGSSKSSRKPSYGAYRGRRASAWSGEQMRGDVGEIVHKIVKHPQSIVSFAVIVVVIGVLLIVIALSSSSKLLQYIGIGFICTGVLVFVVGAAWFYNYSRSRAMDRAKMNHGRTNATNLRLINLQALEEEGKRDDSNSDEEQGTPEDVGKPS